MNVLITGSSRGIGLGLVSQFLSKTNARVIATARSPTESEGLQNLQKEFGEERLITVPLDVKIHESFHQTIECLKSKGVNSIDILIGNAGISNIEHPDDPPLRCDPDQMIEVFRTNVVGNMLLLQHFFPFLLNGTLKLVVFLSSSLGSKVHATQSGGGVTSYRVSKAGLNMFGVLCGKDDTIRDNGIKTVILHPGWVKTDMGLVKGQPAKLDLDFSTGCILNLLESAALSQIKEQGNHKLRENFNFETPFETIESKQEYEDFLQQLKTDSFAYVAYDGKLLPW